MLFRTGYKKNLRYWVPPVILDQLAYAKVRIAYQKMKPILFQNKKFKNIHKGERCFLLGSGPSIKLQNLKPLKNEVVFALNNFYVHPDFQEIMSGNKQKYYVVAPTHRPQARQEWVDWFTDMSKNMPINAALLFGINNYKDKDNIKSITEEHKLFSKHIVHWFFPAINSDGATYNFREQDIDVSLPIISGGTVSIYALIWALYCGFSEIYLLGMDHDYFLYDAEDKMRMYDHAIHQNNEFQRVFGDEFYINEFLRQYKIFTKYKMLGKWHKGHIYNASAGGVLKVFPKVKFEELFA